MRSIVVVLLLAHFSLFGQKKKMAEDVLVNEKAEWFEGSILLNDGSQLTGLIKYDDNSAVLSFQDGTSSKVFTSSRVATFQFFDEAMQKQRVFYAFPYEDPKTMAMRPQFFEVIREYDSFAILGKTDPVDVDRKMSKNPLVYTSPDGTGIMSSTRLVVSQVETIYLMNTEGDIKPYFKTVNEDKSGIQLSDGTSHKMIDDEVIQEFIPEPTLKKLKTFAKENNLKFSRKEDFLQILDYYDTIKN